MPRSPEITHKIMSSIHSKGTNPERLLGSALYNLGLRYRKHYNIIGNPDIVFVKARLAIFCDGDFWHGNNWKIRGLNSFEEELAGYTHFWANKILTNVKRDKKVNTTLKKNGWKVLRYWENEIKGDADKVASQIEKIYQKLCTINNEK